MTGVAHTIARVVESLNYDLSDINALVKRAQHVDFGLSAEVEFAALVAWLGRCRLIHGLEQTHMQSTGQAADLKIPDLLAVLRHKDTSKSVLVEVKTTEGLELELKPDYLAALQAYSASVGHPLVIAWRPRLVGSWLVFDPAQVQTDGNNKLSFERAIRDDLMSSLFGDFVVILKEGVGLTFRFSFIGPRTPTEDGFTQLSKIEEVYWHDASGKKSKTPPTGILWAILAASRFEENISDTELRQTWAAHGGVLHAQHILRVAAGYGCKEGEGVHWRKVGTDLSAVLGRNQLETDLASGFGPFTQYIFFQVPHCWPAWMPSDWSGGASSPQVVLNPSTLGSGTITRATIIPTTPPANSNPQRG